MSISKLKISKTLCQIPGKPNLSSISPPTSPPTHIATLPLVKKPPLAPPKTPSASPANVPTLSQALYSLGEDTIPQP